MIQRFEQSQAAQIMVEAVPDHLVDQYGIVDVTIPPGNGPELAVWDELRRELGGLVEQSRQLL